MSLLRAEEYHALAGVKLSGKVADLGGDPRSAYWKLFEGTCSFTTVNIDPLTKPDITADLEGKLPIPDGTYDAALLINVLEHIYRYRELLAEVRRILRADGNLVIVVPYLFPYHPSPNDYHRFSRTALERTLHEAGFIVDSVLPLGTGVFAARWLFLERLLPARIQHLLSIVIYPLVHIADYCFNAAARALKKQYAPSDYALGFLVTAHTRA